LDSTLSKPTIYFIGAHTILHLNNLLILGLKILLSIVKSVKSALF